MEMVYLNDQEFYALYKLVMLIERGKRMEDFEFELQFIIPAQGVRTDYSRSGMFALHCLKEYCSLFKITIDKIYLPDSKTSRGFYSSSLKELQDYLAQKPGVPALVAQREFVDALVKGKAKNAHLRLTGMMRCGECGCMITAEEKVKRQKNGNVHHYVYYHCTKRKNPDCTQVSIEITELKKQIVSKIESF